MKDDDLLGRKISRKGAKPMEIALVEQILPFYLRVGLFCYILRPSPKHEVCNPVLVSRRPGLKLSYSRLM
jgi:hypothetical protein